MVIQVVNLITAGTFFLLASVCLCCQFFFNQDKTTHSEMEKDYHIKKILAILLT